MGAKRTGKAVNADSERFVAIPVYSYSGKGMFVAEMMFREKRVPG